MENHKRGWFWLINQPTYLTLYQSIKASKGSCWEEISHEARYISLVSQPPLGSSLDIMLSSASLASQNHSTWSEFSKWPISYAHSNAWTLATSGVIVWEILEAMKRTTSPLWSRSTSAKSNNLDPIAAYVLALNHPGWGLDQPQHS